MSHSIFGWSYPPGAANDLNAPYNQEDGPCAVCGKPVDGDGQDPRFCRCEPCPVCEEVGCIEHIPQALLLQEYYRFQALAYGYEAELKRRYNQQPTLCQRCKKPLSWEEAFQAEGMPYHALCEERQIEEDEERANQ